ncbi:MAG: hypothetical protein KY432_01350 [Acidobacteria bacterium]|nr:hypothetical protein [Acidobacteriota bacterium]
MRPKNKDLTLKPCALTLKPCALAEGIVVVRRHGGAGAARDQARRAEVVERKMADAD